MGGYFVSLSVTSLRDKPLNGIEAANAYWDWYLAQIDKMSRFVIARDIKRYLGVGFPEERRWNQRKSEFEYTLGDCSGTGFTGMMAVAHTACVITNRNVRDLDKLLKPFGFRCKKPPNDDSVALSCRFTVFRNQLASLGEIDDLDNEEAILIGIDPCDRADDYSLSCRQLLPRELSVVKSRVLSGLCFCPWCNNRPAGKRRPAGTKR